MQLVVVREQAPLRTKDHRRIERTPRVAALGRHAAADDRDAQLASPLGERTLDRRRLRPRLEQGFSELDTRLVGAEKREVLRQDDKGCAGLGRAFNPLLTLAEVACDVVLATELNGSYR